MKKFKIDFLLTKTSSSKLITRKQIKSEIESWLTDLGFDIEQVNIEPVQKKGKVK